jgi:hypothetical protein
VSKDYVAQNVRERERLGQLVARLSDDDMARQLNDDWTVGDALAHLAFYDRRSQVLLELFARDGVSASPYDYETINQALLHLTRRMPPQAVKEEVLAAADAADAAAAALPEALLAEIATRNEVRPNRAEHRRNHLNEIEAALAAG